MTEQEIINNMQMKLALQDAKFNAFMDEMKDFKQEIRDRDNQRAAEIAEIRQSTEAKFTEIRQMVHSMHNQNIVVIIGVIAIAVAVFLK